MERQPLTPKQFDDSFKNARLIWTAEAIAQRIGTSADFVTDTLINMPDSPVKKIGRRYCADEAKLMAFFQS